MPMVSRFHCVVSKLKSGNEEKICVIDEIVLVSPSFYETVGTEEKMVNESMEEIVPSEEVVKLDEETAMEQRVGREVFPEIKPQEILNPDYPVVNVVKDLKEGKAGLGFDKKDSTESSAIQETGLEFYKEDKDMELKREAGLKLMSRCRSLPVSHKSRVIGDSLVQQLVSEDKTEIYEATIDVEEKTVMLKRSESVKTRGIESSLELSKKHSNSFKETKGSEDNLVDKKASSGSMKSIDRKRSKSSHLGTCLCCTTGTS